MKINSISASSMQNAVDCLAKFYAENVLYTPRSGNNDPADVGTACHGALEDYVREVYQKKNAEPSLELLNTFYAKSYADTFGTLDQGAPTYKDGLQMLARWYDRTDLSDATILSMESKETFMFKTPQGPKKLNYICDRVDLIEENGRKTIRLVDYKTVRANLTPEMLQSKVQARIYAMCLMLQYKDMEVDEFEIQFDLLRHEPVSVTFTVEQNRETWVWLKSLVKRIHEADETNLRKLEQPNSGCNFCARRATCSTLQKNIDGGGIHALSEYDMLQRLELIDAQMKANKYLKEEIENILLTTAQENNEIEWENGEYEVVFKSRRSRKFDEDAAREIMGAELASKYSSMTVTQLEKVLKDDDSGLNISQRSMLRSLIEVEFGVPKPKVTRKSGL